jgi:hypothetical protein
MGMSFPATIHSDRMPATVCPTASQAMFQASSLAMFRWMFRWDSMSPASLQAVFLPDKAFRVLLQASILPDKAFRVLFRVLLQASILPDKAFRASFRALLQAGSVKSPAAASDSTVARPKAPRAAWRPTWAPRAASIHVFPAASWNRILNLGLKRNRSAAAESSCETGRTSAPGRACSRSPTTNRSGLSLKSGSWGR